MSVKHGLQTNRFEYKYLISEPAAAAIRDYVRGYLEADAYSAAREGVGYPIHSLYCDDPSLRLCRATMHGLKNRYKLRVRFYDDEADHPVFFEIKRRANDAILKERVAVPRSAAALLLSGYFPPRGELSDVSAKGWDTLCRFCEWYTELGARGQLFVSYMREAFFSPEDNSVRVTFDRRVRGGRYDGELRVGPCAEWAPARIAGVILEIKFTTRFPIWLAEMARIFNLQRRSVPKYIECAQALGTISPTDYRVQRWDVA